MKSFDELTHQDMFFLLAGPCVIEGEEMALRIAEHIARLAERLHIPYVFKGSFKKPTAPVSTPSPASATRKP